MQYEKIIEYNYQDNSAQYLSDRTQYRCRFCGKTKTKNDFRKVAHAISECVGNRTLRTNYECDDCNIKFANNEEKELGDLIKFIKANRSLTGKKGKIKHNKNVNIQYDDNKKEMNISVNEFYDKNFFIEKTECDNGNIKINFVNKITINLRLVYKALLKFFLSIIPENKVEEFKPAYNFLVKDDNRDGLLVNLIIYKNLKRKYKVALYENTLKNSNTPKYIGILDVYQFSYIMFFDFNIPNNYLPHIMMPDILNINKNNIYETFFADYSYSKKTICQIDEISGIKKIIPNP